MTIEVEVLDDPRRGTLVAVTLDGEGVDREAAARRVSEILGAYTLAHEVTWA